MRLGKLGKLALSMVTIPLSQACSDGRSGSRTFEVRAEVLSGDQVYTGAGVRTLRFERRLRISSETPAIVWSEAGEATVVPLADGQALYVLLDGLDFPTSTVSKLAKPAGGETLLAAIDRAIGEGQSGAVTRYEYIDEVDKGRWPYPRMVYFPDPADNSAVRIVEPGGNFSIEGRDYQITSLWIDEAHGSTNHSAIPSVGQYDTGIEVRSPGHRGGRHIDYPGIYPSNFSNGQHKRR